MTSCSGGTRSIQLSYGRRGPQSSLARRGRPTHVWRCPCAPGRRSVCAGALAGVRLLTGERSRAPRPHSLYCGRSSLGRGWDGRKVWQPALSRRIGCERPFPVHVPSARRPDRLGRRRARRDEAPGLPRDDFRNLRGARQPRFGGDSPCCPRCAARGLDVGMLHFCGSTAGKGLIQLRGGRRTSGA